MNLRSLTGRWKGEYTYGQGYPIELEGKSVPFIMELTFDGNLFHGTCVDEESKHLFNRPAIINGVIEDNYVSFIKKYPCFWTSDENGETVLMPDIPSAPIHYTGTLRKRGLFFAYFFEGEWEVTTPVKYENGEIEYYTGFGTWTMKR